MKFLILFALVAAAAADYHDDTFHFSSTASVSGLTGLQKSAVVQTATPVITKKYTTVSAPAVARQYTTVQAETPVFSSFVSQQPAYTQQYQQYQQYKQVASPVLVKSIEEEIPAYSQQYTVKQFQQPAVYNQQYAVKQVVQPVYNQQYAVKQVVQPVYSQQYAVKQVAKPVYTQYSAVQEVAKPVYSQYSAVKEITKPVYTQYSAVQEAAKPVYSQYSAIKEVAKPIAVSQYSANNLYSQQYSDSVSTYANAYNGPQFRILSQVQEADPAGPYKLSYSTENGIQATEQGSLVAGAEGGVVASQGSYSYTGPDGVVYTVNYIADENGFRASGAHLPTPPAIPAEILKSLEENAASGEQYDDQGRLIYKN